MATKKNTSDEPVNDLGAPENSAENGTPEGAEQDAETPVVSEETAERLAEAGAALEEALGEMGEEVDGALDEAQREIEEALGAIRNEIAAIQIEEAQERARSWIRRHPALTAGLAIGAGVLVSVLVARSFRRPDPTLAGRAKRYSKQALDVADDLGDLIAARASEAGSALRQQAHHAAGMLAESTGDLQTAVQQHAKEGYTFAERMVDAAKATAAALIVQKGIDWLRRY